MIDNDLPAASELIPLLALCSGKVEYRREGCGVYVYLEKLRFSARGTPMEMDVLLCLNHNNSSYPTKLYLAENVGCDLNWNENPVIFGRQWHTFSWAGVSPDYPIFEVLAMHLRAMEPEFC